MKRILDRTFRYVPSHETNIKKLFARERKRIAKLKEEQAAIEAEALAKVRKLGGPAK